MNFTKTTHRKFGYYITENTFVGQKMSTSHAQAKLNLYKKFKIWLPPTLEFVTVFKKLIFFSNFFRNYDFYENFRTHITKKFLWNSPRYVVQMKEQKICFRKKKKKWGGVGVGTGSNFTLKFLIIFEIVKKILLYHNITFLYIFLV